MPTLQSARPCPELRSFVRAYAQRRIEAGEVEIVESVPAQLEQVLNFEVGAPPGILHRNGEMSAAVWIGGAQTSFPGYMRLCPGVESFAVFFLPAGFSHLFGIPMREFTDCLHDAGSVLGTAVRLLWNRLGEANSFSQRVAIVDKFLLRRIGRIRDITRIEAAAADLFRRHGAVRIAALAYQHGMGLRQFERSFREQTGASPKTFARIARFQAALDAKLATPDRSWLEIAHNFGYHDQMHMIHDFEKLGRDTPSRLITQMGDVRPPALTGGEM